MKWMAGIVLLSLSALLLDPVSVWRGVVGMWLSGVAFLVLFGWKRI